MTTPRDDLPAAAPPRRRRLMRRIMIDLALVLATGYLLLAVLAGCAVDRMMFFPPRSTYNEGGALIKLTAADGVRIAAIHLPNPSAHYTILFSHGNGEDLGMILPDLSALQQHGFAVFAYDYRGYGRSGGEAKHGQIVLDINAAYKHLTDDLHVPPEHIIIYGRSLGGGPSTDLAAREPCAGLVLQSAFVSAFRVVTRWPLLPWDCFPNLSLIGKVHAPVLILHGAADGVIGFWHGQKLYAAAHEPKLCLWVKGAGHNDFVDVAGDAYWQALDDFRKLIEQTQDAPPPATKEKTL